MRDAEFGSCDLRLARTATHPDDLSASSSPYGWDCPSPASWPHHMTAAQASISSTAIRAAEGQTLLALPEAVERGDLLPGRDEIVVVALSVVLVTLVLQGLTLIPLTNKLGGSPLTTTRLR